jgi:hypothetical protein
MYSVSVAVDGDDYGIWDKMDGGDVDSNEKKYKPGGMAPEISLGGSRTVSNVIVSRYYDLDRDGSIIKTLFDRAGKGQVTVTKQPLDINEVPYGEPIVYQGTLKMAKAPAVDSESSEEGRVEIEISSAAIIG